MDAFDYKGLKPKIIDKNELEVPSCNLNIILGRGSLEGNKLSKNKYIQTWCS